jgi:translation initiation factor 1A
MSKNKGKGNKNKKKVSRENVKERRELVFKENGQEYAQILKMLGNGRCDAYCFDGIRRLCHIRGKLRKRVWINVGDIVLIGLRDFQDKKGDIIQKYHFEEARILKAYGELPTNIFINETSQLDNLEKKNESNDPGFEFETKEKHVYD